jgi:hypothetical protein
VDLVWPTLAGGCHTSRDTLTAITAAGFQVTRSRRFRFPDSRVPSPAAPHVLGVAHRPATAPSGGRRSVEEAGVAPPSFAPRPWLPYGGKGH